MADTMCRMHSYSQKSKNKWYMRLFLVDTWTGTACLGFPSRHLKEKYTSASYAKERSVVSDRQRKRRVDKMSNSKTNTRS